MRNIFGNDNPSDFFHFGFPLSFSWLDSCLYYDYRLYLEAATVIEGVLKNFANFTGNHLCWSLFLVKSQAFKKGRY